jgi:hypothetical protein
MKPLSTTTLTKLKRAVFAAALALTYFILAAKLGYAGKFAPQNSPASWSEVARRLDGYVLLSAAIGVLAFLWPSRR